MRLLKHKEQLFSSINDDLYILSLFCPTVISRPVQFVHKEKKLARSGLPQHPCHLQHRPSMRKVQFQSENTQLM
ncbi:hypothetical protein BU23DRAFT_113261 [Bimuria novae-zelandiae CBS 107.79]|uniref:Uncharacterized protein n=1 Tax=Bimuria novae-zelandiae CBS 107.79 TaxID=1447943 RepID=A0A6A5VBS5_9PLEO|nr:hypothetical protein BU23DRAFT_113261 [Bimuria novae-zelandiae CBS 107.79]